MDENYKVVIVYPRTSMDCWRSWVGGAGTHLALFDSSGSRRYCSECRQCSVQSPSIFGHNSSAHDAGGYLQHFLSIANIISLVPKQSAYLTILPGIALNVTARFYIGKYISRLGSLQA